jgi:hypothetical protein
MMGSCDVGKKKELLAAALAEYASVCKTPTELEALPNGSIIFGQIEEYTGHYLLVKDDLAWADSGGPYGEADLICPSWFTFDILMESGEIEIVDDYTPELPVLVLYSFYLDVNDGV